MKSRSIFLLVITFIAVAGCAHFMPPDPAALLEKRVTAHWQAKVDKRWGDAYDCYCRSLKSEADKKDYVASSNLDITAFTIDDLVVAEDGTTATVNIVCDLLFRGIKFPGATFKEDWSYVNHDWCLAKKGGFNTLFEKK